MMIGLFIENSLRWKSIHCGSQANKKTGNEIAVRISTLKEISSFDDEILDKKTKLFILLIFYPKYLNILIHSI